MIRTQSSRVLVVAVIACLALAGTAVQAQKKSAKQAESLTKSADDAKKQVSEVADQLAKMLEGYNSIIDGSAKNAQSAYKKLVGDLKGTEKMIQSADKKLQALDKETKKFFADWEKDLEAYSSEDLKQKSMTRLEESKNRYAALGEALDQANEIFSPVVANLNDQILYLGRDLSPEAIADLQDEAEELNQQVADAKDQVQSLIDSVDKEPVVED